MDYNNKPESYYKFPRPEMLEFLPKEAKYVLDVGCGQGTFGDQIKIVNNAEVWGIEYMPKEGKKAKAILNNVFIGAVEEFIKDLPDNYFDAIYFNDVLEHLTYPDQVLKNLMPKLKNKGLIISSIPNMRYFRNFKKLVVNGEWDYEDHGVMDKTHLRWFTKKSIRNMYEHIGFKVLQHEGINASRSIKPILYNVLFCFTAKDIKYKQFATVAQKIK